MFDVGQGNAIETVFVPEPTEAPCPCPPRPVAPWGGRRCSTGAQGFSRNLRTAETIAQLSFAERTLRQARRVDERVIFQRGHDGHG
jgi:23S rRNA (adenine2503-C2)-methyltransferase